MFRRIKKWLFGAPAATPETQQIELTVTLTRVDETEVEKTPSWHKHAIDAKPIGARTTEENKSQASFRSSVTKLGPPPSKKATQEEKDAWLTAARLSRVDDSIEMEAQGIKTGLMHVSALLPHSRPSHAARHGKVFTQEETRAFFESPENQKGCTCAVVEVLLDENGKPILSARLKKQHAAELAAWRKARRERAKTKG